MQPTAMVAKLWVITEKANHVRPNLKTGLAEEQKS